MSQEPTTLKFFSRKMIAIFIPAILCWLFTFLGLYFFKDYGWAIFIFVPFFIGMSAAVLYGRHRPLEKIRNYLGIAALSLLLYCAGLLLFALEGIICLVMAAPLAIPITFVGCIGGVEIIKRTDNSALPITAGFGLLIPLLMSFESVNKNEPPVFSTTTSIVINQAPEKVWQQVITFSRIEEPTELLFKAGIAYPTHAEIKGTGKGAIRYCNFSTGRFVEPITQWQEPTLLAFSVEETPAPLKEISPYDIEPAHLHGYFVSQKGQFRLTRLPGNRTLLEGTTWYYHKIQPAFYWKYWSDHIIHKIHNRVLQHIRKEAEAMP